MASPEKWPGLLDGQEPTPEAPAPEAPTGELKNIGSGISFRTSRAEYKWIGIDDDGNIWQRSGGAGPHAERIPQKNVFIGNAKDQGSYQKIVEQIGDQQLWKGKGGFTGFKDDPELAKSILASLSPFKGRGRPDAPGQQQPAPEAPVQQPGQPQQPDVIPSPELPWFRDDQQPGQQKPPWQGGGWRPPWQTQQPPWWDGGRQEPAHRKPGMHDPRWGHEPLPGPIGLSRRWDGGRMEPVLPDDWQIRARHRQRPPGPIHGGPVQPPPWQQPVQPPPGLDKWSPYPEGWTGVGGTSLPPGMAGLTVVQTFYNPLKKQVYTGSPSTMPSGPGWTSKKPEAFIGWQAPRPPGLGGGQQQQPPGGPPQASQPFVGSKAWGVQQRGEAEAAAVRSRKEAQTMGPLQQSPAQEHPQLGTQEDIIRNVKAKAGQQKPAQGGMWESPAAKQWKAGNQKPFSFSSPGNKVQQRENIFRGTKAQRFQQKLDKRRGWGKTPPGGWRM